MLLCGTYWISHTFKTHTFCIALLWQETKNKCNYSFTLIKQGWFLNAFMRNSFTCSSSSVVVLLHCFSLTVNSWIVVPSPKQRWPYFHKEMTFFYPVFDFQSTLLQVKNNDSKIFNVKTILQSNSNIIVPMIPHGVSHGGHRRHISYLHYDSFCSKWKSNIVQFWLNYVTVNTETDQSKGNL